MLTTIGQVSTRIFSGGTPSTSDDSLWGGHIPWLSSGETSQDFIESTEKTITQRGVDNSSTKLAKRNAIVIASAGQGHTRGQVSFCLIDTYVNQSIIAIEVDESKANPLFVYYNLKQRYEELRQISDGSSIRGSITTQMISDISIDLPPIQIQDTIVEILLSLAYKIKINNQINRNLADICQTEFDKLYKSSNSTVKLSELAEVCYGKDHKCLNDGPFPVYGSGGIMRFAERPLYDGKESVLIPRKGSLNNIMFLSEPFWSVDTMFYTKMKSPHVAKYLYYYLKRQDLASMNAGSAVPSMTTDILNEMDVPIPDDSSLVLFDEKLEPMFEIMHYNKKENTKLAVIRDYLLPKLMSGEIDVSKLEMSN